ncbi:uncharacterized abhydrolase domain-containing protein DDB_G0269086 [Ricinus communis]|uniref:uncharacterized abhydrolase domain-containing protein DDB_G0269086 n=1 Tax=Ricinus communis TaxID=3988 RepID=UPI00201AFC2C|nr:uncharacterized abhydrolase domain-containing protein DDB_G0269086 [Ricinus communis]
MATSESSTSSLHTTTTPEEPIETKVIGEVKPMEQETVLLSKEVKEGETEELSSEAKQISILEEEAEDKQTKPPAVEMKIEHDSVVDVPGKDKIEAEKDPVPHSHGQSDPELVADTVNGEQVTQPTTESVAQVLEQPAKASVVETQLEQPEIIDASAPSVEVVEKPKELSDILPSKESEEVIVKDVDDSEAVSKEVKKPEMHVLEADIKQEEESVAAEQVEKLKSVEEVGRPQEPPEVLSIQESEAVVKDVEVSVAASKEVDEPESVVPKADEKPKEQSEVTQQVETDLVVPEVEAKPKEQSETEQVEPESVVPEVETKPKEQPEVTEQVEKIQSVEVVEEQQESLEVLPVIEPEAALVKDKDTEESEVVKDASKPESTAPEVEVKQEEQSVVSEIEKTNLLDPEIEVKKEEQSAAREVEKTELLDSEVEVKPEEHSVAAEVEKMKLLDPEVVVPEEQPAAAEVEKTKLLDSEVEVKLEEESEVVVIEEVEKPKLLDPEAKVKPKEESEVAEVELKSKDEKTEPVQSDVKVKADGEPEVSQTLTEEGSLADKVEDSTSVEEKEASKEAESCTSSLPDVTVKAALEDGRKEGEGTIVAEVLSKEAEVDIKKGDEEKEENTIKTIDRDVLNEEVAQPIKVDDVKNAVSSAEVIERSFEEEITGKGVEPIVENKGEENLTDEKLALVETRNDVDVEVKRDETTTTVAESVQESQDSAVKEVSANTGEDKLEKENVEESTKGGDDVKTSRDLPTEVPAKPNQKQSNNILTKVKQSLVKAKKAIIGKSPSSKTLASDTKDDIKVK